METIELTHPLVVKNMNPKVPTKIRRLIIKTMFNCHGKRQFTRKFMFPLTLNFEPTLRVNLRIFIGTLALAFYTTSVVEKF